MTGIIPNNNEFLAVNQLTIKEDNRSRRPDIILFINGLPLVVIELKNASNDKADLYAAYNQLQTYKREIPSLFTYNALLVISDGSYASAGSLTADYNRFSTWKNPIDRSPLTPLSKGGKDEFINELEILTLGMLNQETLLDLIKHFTIYEKGKKEDPKTNLISITTEKKIAAYHQYYAVNKALASIIKAASIDGDRRGGVIWHTQGSGKSLSMVFLCGKLVLCFALNNPTIVILSDRNDLDDQLFYIFAECQQLLRQTPQQADNRTQLQELLTINSGGIIFTTVQKFSPANDETIYPELSNRSNIIVLADEAHRSQYGFKARQVNIKDNQGNVIGKETKYGFAKYIRDALPNASFVGFTGTPIEETDKNTSAIFGSYIDVYDIAQAVRDGATVPIYYEGRLIAVDLDENSRQFLEELEEELVYEPTISQEIKAKYTGLEAIVGSSKRIETIALDIINHFQERQKLNKGKGLIVTMGRQIAANLYDAIIRINPDWHSNDLKTGKIKVVMTTNATDTGNLTQHQTTKKERQLLAQRLKDPENSLEMVIVCDMWLTGFDAPCLHTMYIDKPLKGHNLMQAIARINRVYFEKQGGLVVDYLGLAAELKQALLFYSQSGGQGNRTLDQDVAVALLLSKLEIVMQIMSGYQYDNFLEASTSPRDKLNILKGATNYVSAPDIKESFLNEVTALSKVYSLAVPAKEAMENAVKISFFQAIQASLRKLEGDSEGRGSNREMETAIRQVIDESLVSDTVINIFEEAGLKNPNTSIISDEFMAEVKNMEHQNLAVELLLKLLNDQIKAKKKSNIVQSRNLEEMLEAAIRRYYNQAISVTDVIEELINIAKEDKAATLRGEKLELEPYELAFYDALAQNESAREVMGVDKLRSLAIVLAARIRQNASIDWNLKESARSKMRIMVKRLLRQYGYPPDMEAFWP